jgi:thiol-disulfide isomerase/thioredoxin
MNYKSHAKQMIFRIAGRSKRILLVVLIVAVLQVTGLMGATIQATQWVLLQTGLRDANEETSTSTTPFDYNFTIKDLQGKRIPFDQFKGKVVFLNLWATWCGPCRAEMPGIQELYENSDKEKVAFVMLSIDRDSDLPKVSDYMSKRGFTFQAYMPSGYLPDQLQVPSIPTTFVLSKEGLIVKKEVGSMQYNTPKFQKFLEDLSK